MPAEVKQVCVPVLWLSISSQMFACLLRRAARQLTWIRDRAEDMRTMQAIYDREIVHFITAARVREGGASKLRRNEARPAGLGSLMQKNMFSKEMTSNAKKSYEVKDLS